MSATNYPSRLKKVVLVIGGTGAQGQVISQAIAPRGVDSPYSLRILTRDPTNKRVQELYGDRQDVELVIGEPASVGSVGVFLTRCMFERLLHGLYRYRRADARLLRRVYQH